jgi:DNA-binding MarR family transcriptional regulator
VTKPEERFVRDGQGAWVGMLRVHSMVVRRLDAKLAGSHGMTLNEFEVLLKLHLAGGSLRMSRLAEAALLSRSGLTRIVDELEAQGLVRRETDEDDGRVWLATLTRRGATRFAAARDAHIANVHELFLDPLTAAQRKALAQSWETIEAAMPADPEQLPPARANRSRRRPARRVS